MKLEPDRIRIDESDIKEIFGLFSSPTRHERQQMYDPSSPHYYKNLDAMEPYEITQEKREFALDAWRAVLGALSRNGFILVKDGKEIDLKFIDECFL
jgi:hypothetical protein